jgi:hypothetical protein
MVSAVIREVSDAASTRVSGFRIGSSPLRRCRPYSELGSRSVAQVEDLSSGLPVQVVTRDGVAVGVGVGLRGGCRLQPARATLRLVRSATQRRDQADIDVLPR